MQFYPTFLDTYVPDQAERAQAFAAVENIPSIARKAQFCFRWIDTVYQLRTSADRRSFLLNLICFAARIEGLFFRDESMHMAFAFDVVETARREEPGLFDEQMTVQVRDMLAEAVDCEAQFAEDLLGP